MASGVYALLGVIVGAYSTGLFGYLTTRRAERRDVRTAARLVREDVVAIGPALETMLQLGWFAEVELSVAGWEEHRATVAGEVTSYVWDNIADAVSSVGRVEIMDRTLIRTTEGFLAPEALPPDTRQLVEGTLTSLRLARQRRDDLD